MAKKPPSEKNRKLSSIKAKEPDGWEPLRKKRLPITYGKSYPSKLRAPRGAIKPTPTWRSPSSAKAQEAQPGRSELRAKAIETSAGAIGREAGMSPGFGSLKGNRLV